MDYKEEYQKALERAKKGLPIDEVFPELKESEDERIRKELLEVIRHCYEDGGYALCTDDYKKYSAYLEKQKYEYEVFEPVESTLEYKMGFKADVESVKQKEQKPAARSEEDENVIADYLYTLNVGFTQAASRERAKDILSLLRPNPWKPSEEQMEALLWCAAHLGGADHRVLAELYEHLKKLI